MYDSWDVEHDRQNFLILGQFLPFYPCPPTNNPENQNFEMKKTPGDIVIYTSVP